MVICQNKTQGDYKSHCPVGQSPNLSRGENFLETEKTKKAIYQKFQLFLYRIAKNIDWAINWLFAKSKTQEHYKN